MVESRYDTEDAEEVEVATEGVTLDLLIWKMFLKPMHGLLEATLDLNYGLADLGVFLPLGTRVRVPRPIAPDAAPDVVGLWD